MQLTNDYRQVVQECEPVFRNVLRDMRDNREERPLGSLIPADLDTEASIDELFDKYTNGVRDGRFTICDFSRPTPDTAVVEFRNVDFMSGRGAELIYSVRPDNSVQYLRKGMLFRS